MDEAKIGRDGITILNNMHFWEPKEEGDPIKVEQAVLQRRFSLNV